MGTKPRFFCDNCGAEVDKSAKSCPACGRFFASVRCPACGFTGGEEDFVRGCPSCGYSTPPGGPTAKDVSGRRGQRAPREPGFALPFWLYLIAALALICVLALLYNSLR
ncbi:MAG: zinc ribbon domain-containing protein [Treponema sp.]|jgi:ssDNA-binding Zn-finger/Zn-ribbon topoisomerase 1|nr:zinc ribbon domain-containing protein [Treponema sp.]